jgi:hypothetical protein
MEISVYNGGHIVPDEYEAHIVFLEKNGGSSVLVKLLRNLGYSKYTLEKLKQAITPTITAVNPNPDKTFIKYQSSEKSEFNKISESAYKTIDFSKLPDHLKIKNIELGKLYQEMSFEAAGLEYQETDEQRLEKALKITSLAADRRAIYKEIDEYLNASEPSAKITYTFPADKSECIKDLSRKRVQRSKLKNNKLREKEYNMICAYVLELEKHIQTLNG